MNFECDEDQKMVRETVRRYAADSLAPNAEAWDEHEQVPRAVFDELRDLGLLGLTLPAQAGGSGLDDHAALLCIEELARYDASTALSVVAHSVLVGNLAQTLGRDDLVADLASGRLLGTWSMSDSPVELDRGESVVLDGAARDLVQCRNADVAVVFGRAEGGQRRAAIVEADGVDLERTPNDGPLGCRAADLGTWSIESVDIDESALAGGDVEDLDAVITRVHDRAVSFLGAVAVGIARGALEEGLAYANDREQFGQPISRFQVTQFKLADMTTRVDAARLSVLRSASDDASAGRRARAASLASDVALDVADEAVQLHGGYGYTSEYPVERYLRDARALASMLGGATRRAATSTSELASHASIFA